MMIKAAWPVSLFFAVLIQLVQDSLSILKALLMLERLKTRPVRGWLSLEVVSSWGGLETGDLALVRLNISQSLRDTDQIHSAVLALGNLYAEILKWLNETEEATLKTSRDILVLSSRLWSMPSIEATIHNWQLPPKLRDRFLAYILNEEQGYQLDDDLDDSFVFTFNELKAAGTFTGKEIKLILANLNSGDLRNNLPMAPSHLHMKIHARFSIHRYSECRLLTPSRSIRLSWRSWELSERHPMGTRMRWHCWRQFSRIHFSLHGICLCQTLMTLLNGHIHAAQASLILSLLPICIPVMCMRSAGCLNCKTFKSVQIHSHLCKFLVSPLRNLSTWP